METRFQVNAVVPRGRRQRKSFGNVGSLAQAPDALVAARLRRLAIQARHNRAGLTALFFGPSGTGKTIAATLARSLGKTVHSVDLSTITADYVGETEKNLAQAFAAAHRQRSILFFDEADALFGKRTDVDDSHDRYANLEVSHLLARVAGHRGIVILSTNTKADIDSAIERRFHAVVRFPKPETPA
jgi:SpoVK/Ycf46/Vps4 family AAA+-type ATPase